MNQNKLSKGNLLNEEGQLAECGYAYSLVRQYDRKAIKSPLHKIKEWDYYLVYNQDFGIALTVADNSYMGLVSATFLNFKAKTEKTFSPMIPLTFGRLSLPPSSHTGNIIVFKPQYEISFTHGKNGRHLKLIMANFEQGQPLIVDLLLTNEPQDSMVIATPFAGMPNAFYYNQKIIGMRAEGTINYLGHDYFMTPDSTFGLLDWGRGVWTYDNTWYWSAANGLIDGKVFGFNLGYGFGDTRAASENMIFYEGKAHKLEEVTFIIPKGENQNDNYMSPWQFTSSDGRFEAEFTPILDRSAHTSLGVVMSKQHQVFGYFSGNAILDDGKVIHMDHFLGFAEKVRNKW